jgi:hypothetical protein
MDGNCDSVVGKGKIIDTSDPQLSDWLVESPGRSRDGPAVAVVPSWGSNTKAHSSSHSPGLPQLSILPSLRVRQGFTKGGKLITCDIS